MAGPGSWAKQMGWRSADTLLALAPYLNLLAPCWDPAGNLLPPCCAFTLNGNAMPSNVNAWAGWVI